MENSEIILLNINGEDKPGLTAALTEILAKHGAFILDIGQSDIHRNLSLGILFKSMHNNSGEIMKDLLFKAYEMDVNIRFTPISEERYSNWVSMQGKNRYIITLLGRILTAKQIAAVSHIIAEQNLNIDNIVRLTGRIPLDEEQRAPKSCVELSVRGTPNDRQQMQQSFLELSSELNFDISFQEESMFRRMRRLICFDMDSTLVQTEVIDELAIRAGVGDQVKAITDLAMQGEIDFEESFRRRVKLLKGLDVSVMREIAEPLPITEGLVRLMRVLK
jgi:phosphoserine phosphatase